MNIFEFLTPKDQTHYINSDSTVRQALEKFDYHKFSVVPIIDDSGHYISIISEGDILRFIKNHASFDLSMAEDTKIVDLEIYRDYKYLTIEASIDDVFSLSMQQNFIPLIDGRGMYIGIIKRKEIINYLVESYKKNN